MAWRLGDEDGFQVYLNAIQRIDPLPRDREQALARRWRQDGEVEAAHELVRANLRYVVKVAHQYRGYGVRLSDLVEEGNIGLLEAVRRFEPERNLRFITYAAYWIRAYMLAFVLKQRSLVGVGTGPLQSKLFFRMARERARIAAALGDDSATDELERRLAERFHTTPDRVRSLVGRIEARDVSLDAAAFRQGETSVLDRLVDPEAPAPDERAAQAERDRQIRRGLDEVMRGLKQRDRYIVERRLLSDDADTLAAVGRHLGLSRERVRQLEARLKAQLRSALADVHQAYAA